MKFTIFLSHLYGFSTSCYAVIREILAKKTPAVAKKTAGDNQIYKMEKCLVGNISEEFRQIIF